MKLTQYIGILLGALYGLGYRILCEESHLEGVYDYYNIYSITFIWIVPIVVGVIPILFARKEILDSKWKPFFFPFFSVLAFFIFMLSSRLEDLLCTLILAFPFLFAAGLVGVVLRQFIKKRKSNTLYSIILLPLILNPLEGFLPKNEETFSAKSEVVIDAPRGAVWVNLIEVPEIAAVEYDFGFYNFIGVPRPVKSELKIIDGQMYRIGHFTEGLKLYETISEIDSLNYVNFKVHIDKSELRNTPTDNHLLKSNYFRFENISYSLSKTKENKTQLTLNCDYILDSNMNFYANFWAKRIIQDFEVKLLEVLKAKAENQNCSH